MTYEQEIDTKIEQARKDIHAMIDAECDKFLAEMQADFEKQKLSYKLSTFFKNLAKELS